MEEIRALRQVYSPFRARSPAEFVAKAAFCGFALAGFPLTGAFMALAVARLFADVSDGLTLGLGYVGSAALGVALLTLLPVFALDESCPQCRESERES